MNRKLLGLTATAFAFCSTLSCSDKSSEIAGLALTDPTATEARIASAAVTLAQNPIEVGETTQATALLLDNRGGPILLSPTWSSSDTSVAKVSAEGAVLAQSPGVASIIATRGGKSGVAPLAVTAVVKPGTVTDLQASVIGSTSVTLSFTQVDDGTGQPAKYDVRYAVAPISWGTATWTTSGTCTAPVAGTAIGSQLSCTVLGLTPATIYNFQAVPFRGTLNLNAVFGSLSNIASATTTASAPPPPAPVASVTVSPASSNLVIGATVQLLVTARDASDSVLTGRIVTSSSADAGIASVNSLGLVTAVGAGTTQVTVTSEGKSAIATIIVTAPIPPPPVPVASVSVSPASSSLLIGATVQLLVTARDAGNNVLTGRVVTSSSADAGIASVSSLGLVTAIGAGTTQITVTSEGQSAIATIIVSASAPPPPVKPSTVTDLQASVIGSTSVTLSFTQVNDGAGQPAKYDVRYAVAPISWGTATWTTSGTCTAPVAGTAIGSQLSCTVLGLTPATIYNFQLVPFRGTLNLNAVFGSLSNIASATTTASAPPPPAPVASVTVSPASSNLIIGATVQLLVTAFDANGNVLTGRVVTSSSANPAIASVNSLGLVSAVSVGGTQITVISEGKSAIATINVTAPAPVPVASVTVSPASSNLVIGATVQLQVTAFDASNNVLTGRVVTSSSANPAIASVNSLGLVSAVSVGGTQITVISEGKSAIATINVTAPAPVPVASVTVSPTSSSLLIGATVQLSAITRDASNTVLTGRIVTWSSANAGIATVSSSGLVRAVSAGTTQVTATSEGKTSGAAITVTAPVPAPVATVSVSPSSSSLLVGATVQLSATTRDASNNVLTGRAIAWSSSNPAISSVSGSGLVTAIAAGTATITALSETKIGTSSITVTAAPPPPPPPPPGSWRGNEPAGMTRITDRAFNAVVEDGFDSYGTTPATADVPFTIVSDGTAPHSPNNVLRATYPAGFGAGGAPAHSGIPHTGYSKIYICFAVKLSANWVGNGSGVNKYLYEWTSVPHPSFFFAAVGSGSDPLEPRVMFQDMVVSPNPGFVSPNLVPGARIIRGQWQTIEIYIQGNTAGHADGVVDWYLNGVHIGHVASSIQFSAGATAFEVFEIYPIWGGGNSVPAITATQTMDWDHLYVSGRN